ncbi:MAG: hypothetical protein ABW168_22845 [Sedimenticola sp.]
MRTVKELLDENVNSISLKILLLGPQVNNLSDDQRILELQNKRLEIKGALSSLGHTVSYPEDIIDDGSPDPGVGVLHKELLIMNQYDVIVALIGSPGTFVEIGIIASRPQIATKSTLYIDEEEKDGFVMKACQDAEFIGADYNTFKYPEDLTECNLLGFIKKKISSVQMTFFLS